jgi:hypothetical protein
MPPDFSEDECLAGCDKILLLKGFWILQDGGNHETQGRGPGNMPYNYCASQASVITDAEATDHPAGAKNPWHRKKKVAPFPNLVTTRRNRPYRPYDLTGFSGCEPV